jgi:hypothetical protein
LVPLRGRQSNRWKVVFFSRKEAKALVPLRGRQTNTWTVFFLEGRSRSEDPLTFDKFSSFPEEENEIVLLRERLMICMAVFLEDDEQNLLT